MLYPDGPVQKLKKTEFAALEERLRTELLMRQLDMAEVRDRAVLMVLTGNDATGKALVAHRLLEWLDPRHVTTHAYDLPTRHDRRFPAMWRYWAALPGRGRTSIVFGSWYHQPMYERITGALDDVGYRQQLHAIADFEQMLAREGVLILKLWLHLARKDRKARERKAKGKGGLEIQMREWGTQGIDHADGVAAVETMTRITSTAEAPWVVVPDLDPNYRDALAGQALLDCLNRRSRPLPGVAAAPPPPPALETTVAMPSALDRVDLAETVDRKTYDKELPELQDRLRRLTMRKKFRTTGVVAVFEGADAAGKGGCIRRTVRALDPRLYRVHAISAPTDEELAHPYLWRFWRRVPPLGRMTIYDRSWYGRVLVERVEGFAAATDWQRAYHEINRFEADLTDHGLFVAKFWLQISADEQLRRFKAREQTPFKRFKITPEDWRNREKWDAYRVAAADMISRTSTLTAPWTLVPAEDKRVARLTVLRTLCDRLAQA